MNFNEFLVTLKEEDLQNICFDKTKSLSNTVYFIKKDTNRIVYTTDERAAVYGKIREFDNEKDAVENALKRLRAYK